MNIKQNESSDNFNAPDSLYQYAIDLVIETNQASTARLQRLINERLNKQYSYERILMQVERMEQEGLVSPMNADGVRSVLTSPQNQSDEMDDTTPHLK